MLRPVSFSQLSHQPLIPAGTVSLSLVTASSRSLALPVAPTSSQSRALENRTQSTHRSVFLPPTLSHWGRKQSGRNPGLLCHLVPLTPACVSITLSRHVTSRPSFQGAQLIPTMGPPRFLLNQLDILFPYGLRKSILSLTTQWAICLNDLII